MTADTTYNVFVLLKDDETQVDGGFDTDIDATNLLVSATDYDKFRLVGQVTTDSSSNIDVVQGVDDDLEGWKDISTGVASADTEIDILLDTSIFSQFELELIEVSSSSADDSLNVRFSNDGGATFRSGASDYGWFDDMQIGGAGGSDVADSEITLINLEIGNSGTDKAGAIIRITGAPSGARTMIFANAGGQDDGGGNFMSYRRRQNRREPYRQSGR